ncbi:hypothetical protein QBC39DRAFT_364921 [Podospora conica]|nr:hypothetical protein QBC39DRAFT_364921 [Schizothecium conicum]
MHSSPHPHCPLSLCRVGPLPSADHKVRDKGARSKSGSATRAWLERTGQMMPKGAHLSKYQGTCCCSFLSPFSIFHFHFPIHPFRNPKLETHGPPPITTTTTTTTPAKMNFLNRLPGYLPLIHIALAVLLTLELGLISYVVSAAPFPTISFLLFTTIFSLLTLLYLTLAPLYFSHLHHPLAALGAASLSMIFWFAGSIALAAVISSRCFGNAVCGSANAAAAFGFFVWAGWVVVVFVLAREVLESRRGVGAGTGGSVAGGPKPYVAA